MQPQSLLDQAEQRDSYLAKCRESHTNRTARSHSTYVAISSEPASRPSLPDWIKPVAEKCKIVWMHPSADSGLPHTRPGPIVCMPQYFPESRLQVTLTHELIHCWQRLAPDVWKKLYLEQGWRPATEDEIDFIPDEYYNSIRINPDTILAGNWAWKNFLPLPIFQRGDRPKLGETDIRWLDLKSGNLLRSPPADFQTFFGPVSDPEHPAEVAAYSMTDEATFSKYPAWKTFIRFFNK